MATALKSIVNSIVNDVIMPIVSLLTQGTDFTNQFIALDGKSYATLKAAKDAGAATITYGNLIQALINFVIIGLIIFWIVKVYEKTKNKKELAPPAPSKEEVLLTEIRDLLKKK